ncbi:MAG: LysM peptidoglycan-binding domain-containing protein [Rhodomicrobium sp.]|nr:LysM peptidoglycan-binding domain-containing protein [Rhodomicrobium sp.]
MGTESIPASTNVAASNEPIPDAVLDNDIEMVNKFTDVVDNFSDDLTDISKSVETVKEVKREKEKEEDDAKRNPKSETQRIVENVIEVKADNTFDLQNDAKYGDMPASDGTFGKTDYRVKWGDTLESIAAEHDQTVEDLLLANPSLTVDTDIRSGMIIEILDATRIKLSKSIRDAKDRDELKKHVKDYIDYAAADSSTPEDLLPAIREDLLALREAGDAEFTAVLDEEFQTATETWQSQGRTHEVMDRLNQLADAGDIDGLKQTLFDFFKGVARANPDADAIEAQKEIFMAYGPESDVFAEALEQAYFDFNIGQVYEAAAAIADAYAASGPIVAAELLAHYTSPEINDLLTAARIFNAAQPTTNLILFHIAYGDVHPWPGNTSGEPNFSIDFDGKDQILGFISDAIANVSGSVEAAAAIVNVTRRIVLMISTYILPDTLSSVKVGVVSSVLDALYKEDRLFFSLERRILDNDPYQLAKLALVNDLSHYDARRS